MAASILLIDRLAVLVLQRLSGLVFGRGPGTIGVKQHLGAAFPFADVAARRLDLFVGSPAVISVALTDAARHQVDAVAARVTLAGREVLRDAFLTRLPRFLPRRHARLDLFHEFVCNLAYGIVRSGPDFSS